MSSDIRDCNFTELLKPGIGNDEADNPTIKHSYIGSKGDLRVELHYGDFHTGHGRQAALYIHHFAKPADGVFVPLSAMWMYAERDTLHEMIPTLGRQLYGFDTRQDQFRILDAILDYLDDLRKAPPEPRFMTDRSLNAFLESCADEGLGFFVERNGKRDRLT